MLRILNIVCLIDCLCLWISAEQNRPPWRPLELKTGAFLFYSLSLCSHWRCIASFCFGTLNHVHTRLFNVSSLLNPPAELNEGRCWRPTSLLHCWYFALFVGSVLNMWRESESRRIPDTTSLYTFVCFVKKINPAETKIKLLSATPDYTSLCRQCWTGEELCVSNGFFHRIWKCWPNIVQSFSRSKIKNDLFITPVLIKRQKCHICRNIIPQNVSQLIRLHRKHILENKHKEILLSDANWLECSYWECFRSQCTTLLSTSGLLIEVWWGVGAAESAAAAAARWNTWRLLILRLGLITFQSSAVTSLSLWGWGNKYWLTSLESWHGAGVSSHFQLLCFMKYLWFAYHHLVPPYLQQNKSTCWLPSHSLGEPRGLRGKKVVYA